MEKRDYGKEEEERRNKEMKKRQQMIEEMRIGVKWKEEVQGKYKKE